MMKKSKKHHVTSWTMVTLLLTSGALSSGALAVSAVPTPVSATATTAEGDSVEKSSDGQYLSLYPGEVLEESDVQTDLTSDAPIQDTATLKALNDALTFPNRLEVVKEWAEPQSFLEIRFNGQPYYINNKKNKIVTIMTMIFGTDYAFLTISDQVTVYDGIALGTPSTPGAPGDPSTPGTPLSKGDQLLLDNCIDTGRNVRFMHISTISPAGSDKYMLEKDFGKIAYVNKGQRALQIKADHPIYENPQYENEMTKKTQAQISQAYLIVMDPTTKTEEIGYGYKDEATGRYVFIDLDAAEEIDSPVTPDPDPDPDPEPEPTPEPEVPETPEMPDHDDWVSPDVAPRYQSQKGNG